MFIQRTCKKCGETTQIEITERSEAARKSGRLIQHAMPYLSIDLRELMISGTCGRCYDRESGADDDFELSKAEEDDSEVTFQRTCSKCGVLFWISAEKQSFMDWKNGDPIEDALFFHDENTRDMLITNYCECCQNRFYEELQRDH